MSTDFDDTKWYSYTSSTQTMRTWARRLSALDEIPQVFQSAFPPFGECFPYTLLIPEDRVSIFEKRNKQLICVFGDRFVHLEALRNEIKTFSAMFADVLYVEMGKILLHSWMKIVTLTGTRSIRFNTTNDYLFLPIIETIREGMIDSRLPDELILEEDKQALSQFDHLTDVNIKFRNYGRRGVRPGDAVMGIVYQPKRTLQEVRLFNKIIYRRYATDHLSILTKQELILINEEKRIRTDTENPYGGVFTYIPRRQMKEVSFRLDQENKLCIMEISLPGNTRISLEFSTGNDGLNLLRDCLEPTADS
jgi:hypothetical protein